MMHDPISDMLTRMRNALSVQKTEVVFPFSTLKWNMAKILKEQDFIEGFEKVKGPSGNEMISVVLKYRSQKPAMRNLKRISKPAARVYVKKDQLPVVLNHQGIAIISTPQGLMTNKEARKRGLGGEVLCEIF